MLTAFVNASAGLDLADFEVFASKGFMSPQKLDILWRLAKTEPRHDRLCRGAVDPDPQVELVSQVSRASTTIAKRSAADLKSAWYTASPTDNAIVACVLLHCFTVPPSTTITSPREDLQDRRHAAKSELDKTSMTCSSDFPQSYWHTGFG